jgi:hypothetical protein
LSKALHDVDGRKSEWTTNEKNVKKKTGGRKDDCPKFGMRYAFISISICIYKKEYRTRWWSVSGLSGRL